MRSWEQTPEMLKTICDAQAEKIKIQEQLIGSYEKYLHKLETQNKVLNEKVTIQENVIDSQEEVLENQQRIIRKQERMLEILLAENQELGGEISKDVD